MSFDVEYYFPVNQWLVAREDYHRLLKRVYMNGTRNGEPFESYDEYVNFRPRTIYSALFEICAISPYVRLFTQIMLGIAAYRNSSIA